MIEILAKRYIQLHMYMRVNILSKTKQYAEQQRWET